MAKKKKVISSDHDEIEILYEKHINTDKYQIRFTFFFQLMNRQFFQIYLGLSSVMESRKNNSNFNLK